MDDRSRLLPEHLILAKQADLLRGFFKLVALLTATALLLIVLLPGFATAENILEPFLRNTFVLVILGVLYAVLEKGFVLASIYGTISACAALASYTIYQESPGNMQMMALIMFPTCLAGFLPRRNQFWVVYVLNMLLMLFTAWMVMVVKGIDMEYRSIVTLGMLLTLLALIVDSLSSSYRDSIHTTLNQLVQIEAAEEKLSQLDQDLGVAVSEKIHAEIVSNRLEKQGRMALEVAGAGTLNINRTTGDIEASSDFFERYGFKAPREIKTLCQIINEKDRARFEQSVLESSNDRALIEGDFQITAAESTYWMFMLEAGLTMEGHSIMQGVVVDVTSRVLEQQRQVAHDSKVHESQRLESLGMLAGAIAHDFNNLLHVIMLNADLARKELAPDSKPAVSMDRLMTTVERAAELCSELLAYSGRGQFTIEPFNLKNLVSDMQSLLDISIPKGIHVSVLHDDSVPIAQGDLTQIRQVLMNLITNAGEAVDAKTGEIEVSVGSQFFDEETLKARNFIEEIKPGNYVFMTVKDNGPGMDATTTQRMFDPFYTTKETGHGLGLSAVLGIIRGHKGSIEIKSSPGDGTTATVLLPQSESHPTADDLRESDIASAKGSGIILFADDEKDIRQLATVVLEDAGYRVIQAEDGQVAVDLFKKHHEELHLVMLDLMMPVKTGLEAYLEIADIDKSVPVVFSSGFNESEALDQLPPKTRSAFLKKPYLATDLKQFVLDIIGPREG